MDLLFLIEQVYSCQMCNLKQEVHDLSQGPALRIVVRVLRMVSILILHVGSLTRRLMVCYLALGLVFTLNKFTNYRTSSCNGDVATGSGAKAHSYFFTCMS